MSKVSFKKLGEIATFINGYAFKSNEWSSTGLPIIRIQNLNNENAPFNYFKSKIDEKYLVRQGDILISWSGSIGIYEWKGCDALLNQHIFKVKFNKDKINKTYFKYIVRMSLIRALQYVHGSTMKHITKKYFDKILVPIPDIKIQEQIANVLELSESLINSRRTQITLLSSLTQSVFIEMFGDPVNNSRNHPTMPLKELGVIQTGNTPSRKVEEYYGEFIEWIKSDNINTPSDFLTIADEYLSEQGAVKGRIAKAGSILVTCIAGSMECIGNVAIADRDVAFNQQINAITPNNRVDIYFLFNQFKIAKKLVQQASTNSMKGMVSKSSFSEILFIVPDIEEQKKFADIYLEVENQKVLLKKSIEQLENNFNSLLQCAFKGELFNS